MNELLCKHLVCNISLEFTSFAKVNLVSQLRSTDDRLISALQGMHVSVGGSGVHPSE